MSPVVAAPDATPGTGTGTAWSVGGISVNTGPDASGVEWWGNVPEGWEGADAQITAEPRTSGDGEVVMLARRTGQALVASAIAIAPTNALMWAARRQVEAAANAMVRANGTLRVVEPGGAKSLTVRYAGRLKIEQVSATTFRLQLPLLAPSPTKVAA